MAASSVWKFGYGSNISPDFLRTKKQVAVLDCKRCVLNGFVLSFPLGRGLDLVEPSMATLRREADGFVHGTACLLPHEDAVKLDVQGPIRHRDVARPALRRRRARGHGGARRAGVHGEEARARGQPAGACLTCRRFATA